MTLKQHQGGLAMTMGYDLAQRIVTMLAGVTVTTYTHDNAGNLTREDTNGVATQYAYDPENRLIKVTNPDGTLSTYTYQGLDGLRRTKQEPGGAVRTMVWDGSDYLGEY